MVVRVPSLKPAVAKMAPRIASMRETRDMAHSYNIGEVRRWYKSARWLKLREYVLTRDLYTCRQTGVVLTGKSPEPNSPVVDHVIPHKGDERLFWDPNNLQAVSKAYHDSDKRKLEMRHGIT